MSDQHASHSDSKDKDLTKATVPPLAELTDNLGHRIGDDQNSLRAGVRGPSLLEDFHLREKISHFDHERIPERVVHARGAASHGVFQVYDAALAPYTTAGVLTDPARVTPVFVRFSTVAGSRGSADTARDVRGFAVKFYTDEGNWDLVGNNMPVFFIQDAIKFPDLIHAVKPEPNLEIPQASSAHDTFYDFLSLTPESMHMLMWVMSDRALPRAFPMMEGFGVHTFRLVNAEGVSHFVKFHWKPLLGAHSLVWDEAQKIAGKDADFHRRNMAEAIEQGIYPEWEFGVQIIAEDQESMFDFDILDATKLWPEDLVPVQRVGKMTLNRNPDNYFSETEQVAFMPTNIVPGIDFSDDPLLQGRLFSYLDTQISRLGTPNWTELPINRPLAPVSNHQRDGHMRYRIDPGRIAYQPNGLQDNLPTPVPPAQGGFASYPAPLRGPKVRERSQTFGDHYGQAKLFWNSMTPIEREHITKALQFELSKVESRDVRLRMLGHLQQINEVLAAQVARALGEPVHASHAAAMPGGTADSLAETEVLASATSQTTASGGLQRTKGLSLEEDQPKTPRGRKVAILAADGVDAAHVTALTEALTAAGSQGVVVGTHLQALSPGVEATMTLANTSSVLFDAVYVPGGRRSIDTLLHEGDANVFLNEAYKHGKPIAAVGEGVDLLNAATMAKLVQSRPPSPAVTPKAPTPSGAGQESKATAADAGHQDLATHGIIVGAGGDLSTVTAGFLAALAQHRFWGRPHVGLVPA